MSDPALFFHVLLALLKRAAKGEMLRENDMITVWKMDVAIEDPVVINALSFLSHFQVDADLFSRDTEYLEIRKEQAISIIPAIETAFREYVQ